MSNITAMEVEELCRAVGENIRKSFPEMIAELMAASGKDEDSIVSKMVDDKVRELQKSMNKRNANWNMDLSPQESVTIETRLMKKASSDDEVSHDLQSFNDEIYMLTKALGRPLNTLRSFPAYQSRWSELAKALTISVAGSGLEWIPTGFSSQMIEQAEIASEVGQIFETFAMPTNPYIVPVILDDGEAFKGVEDTTDSPAEFSSSTLTTGNLTFDAEKLIALYQVRDEATEDSIIPILPEMRASIARAVAKARDNAIINGQFTGKIDTGYTIATKDSRNLWDGLRKLTPTATNQSGSTWSKSNGLALIRSIVEEMGVYGLRPNDVAIIANANMINKMRGLTEVSTIDKYGAAATVTNGVLASLDGKDIIASQHVNENLNALGVYDASTETKTELIIVHKPSFRRGTRRNFTLEVDKIITQGNIRLVATTREIWKPIRPATETTVGKLYNVTK